MSFLKIGDRVKIKSEYDPGLDWEDYPSSFVDDMLENYGGKICTIADIIEPDYKSERYERKAFNGDTAVYFLKEDKDQYWWDSCMFEPTFIIQKPVNIF